MARGALAATARCGREPIQSGKTISSENPSKFNVSLLGA